MTTFRSAISTSLHRNRPLPARYETTFGALACREWRSRRCGSALLRMPSVRKGVQGSIEKVLPK